MLPDEVLIREVFLNSDTQFAVISGLWGDPLPMLTEEAARTCETVAKLGAYWVRIHSVMQPTTAPWGGDRRGDGAAGGGVPSASVQALHGVGAAGRRLVAHGRGGAQA